MAKAAVEHDTENGKTVRKEEREREKNQQNEGQNYLHRIENRKHQLRIMAVFCFHTPSYRVRSTPKQCQRWLIIKLSTSFVIGSMRTILCDRNFTNRKLKLNEVKTQ